MGRSYLLMVKFTLISLVACSALVLGSTLTKVVSGANKEGPDRIALLAHHRKDRQAHFERNPELMTHDQPAEGFISVRQGQILRVSKTDAVRSAQTSFAGASYEKWDDLEEPIISISHDGSMAWMIVRVLVERTITDPDGAKKAEHFVYAGITTYEKRNGQWLKVVNASTFE